MREFLIFVAVCGGMIAIVPLWIWGATGGNWRAALRALRSYLGILAGLVVVGGGFGLLMAVSEHGFGIFALMLR